MRTTRKFLASLFAAALLASASAPASYGQFWRKKKTAEAADTAIGAAVSTVQGSVQRQAKGAAEWSTANAQEPLNSGETLKTGSDGAAVIALSDGSVLEIGKNSTFVFEGHTKSKVKLRMAVGMLKAWIKKSSRRYSVRTPTSVAAIRGTQFVTLVDLGGGTIWDLFSGGLDISDNFGNSFALVPGFRLEALPAAGLKPAAPIPPSVTMAPKPQVTPPLPGKHGPKGPAPKKDDRKAPLKKREDGAKKPPPPRDGTLLPPPLNNPLQNIQIAPPSEVSPSTP